MRHRLLTACRPSATDAQLARRAAAGDDDAFETLYVRYQPRLEAYCRSIVRHDEDARDAVQNAMTKALVALRRDSPSNVQGWLFRIAHNEAISMLRRRRPTTELADVMHDGRLGPAGDLLLREELRATLDGVRALPHNLQHPLLLRELAGLSYGQVAEVVGGTPAAARKAVFDARIALSADRAGRDEACAVIRQSLSEGDGRRRRARVVRSHLQSCQPCCAWETAQRQRRHHLAALLPAASAAGTAGGWLAGLFGGGTTVAAGVSGSLATNAKVAASLAVIAAGAAPVVERVERSQPAPKVGSSAEPVATTELAARQAVAASTSSAGGSQGTGGTVASARRAATRRAAAAAVTARRAKASDTSADRATAVSQRTASDASSAQRGTSDAAAGPRTNPPAAGSRPGGDAAAGARRRGDAGAGAQATGDAPPVPRHASDGAAPARRDGASGGTRDAAAQPSPRRPGDGTAGGPRAASGARTARAASGARTARAASGARTARAASGARTAGASLGARASSTGTRAATPRGDTPGARRTRSATPRVDGATGSTPEAPAGAADAG